MPELTSAAPVEGWEQQKGFEYPGHICVQQWLETEEVAEVRCETERARIMAAWRYSQTNHSSPDREQLGNPITPLSRLQSPAARTMPRPDLEICFQHSVLCQTGLPYRDPGEGVRLWKRKQGNAALEIEAGRIPDPAKGEHVNAGLPWGVKPRLILAHLNAEALRQGSSAIEIEASLSAFVKRIRGFDGGREIRMFKEQLRCLEAATIRLAVFHGEHAYGINTHLIYAFELWLEKDDRQRVLWQSTIQLSHEYFESLQRHAVPLNEADSGTGSHRHGPRHLCVARTAPSPN